MGQLRLLFLWGDRETFPNMDQGPVESRNGEHMLDAPPTGGPPASAGKCAVVVRVFVVEGEFGSGLKGLQGIKFRSFSDNSHVGIGGAGMVDEPKSAGLVFSVDGFVVIDFHNGNLRLSLCPSSAFASANQFSLIFTDFLPGAEVDLNEETKPFDPTRFDFHRNRPFSVS